VMPLRGRQPAPTSQPIVGRLGKAKISASRRAQGPRPPAPRRLPD
jgi:hypothetical protein